MRTFGLVVFLATLVGAGLYFGGFVSGSADVELTDKGRQTVSEGLDAARNGLNSSLQKAQEGINKGFDEANAATKQEQ